MSRKIRIKRGPKSKLPQLDVAELGFTTDTEQVYIGNATKNIELAKQEKVNEIDTRLTQQLADKATKKDVSEKADKEEMNSLASIKADKTYVDTNLSNVNSRVDGIDRGYGGTYATLAELQTAFPTGNANRYVVSADGKWYYWNGTAWTSGGVFQSTGLADGAVTTKKVAYLKPTHNLFNPKTATIGKNISDTGVITDSNTHTISDFIDVEPNSSYFVSGTCAVRGYDENGNFISGSVNLSGVFNTLSYKKIRLAILNGQVSNFILNKGTIGLSYVENGFNPDTEKTQYQLKKNIEIDTKHMESYVIENKLPQERIDLLKSATSVTTNNYAVVMNDYQVRWRNRQKSYKVDVLSNSPITMHIPQSNPLILDGISEFVVVMYIEDVTKITNIQLGFTGNAWVRDSVISPLKNGWNTIRFQTSGGNLSNWTQASELRLSLYFTSKTTVYLSDVLAIRPEKAKILFVNDHGYSNFKKVAYPQLKARGIPTTWAINPGRLGAQISSVERILSQEEIDELAYDPYSEFSYHAWNPTENYSALMSADELLEEHHKCTMYLQKNGLIPKHYWRAAFTTNMAPEHKVLKPYLDAYASHNASMGLELYPFRDNYNINRWQIHGVTNESIDSRFESLEKTRGVLVCYTHGLDDSGGIHLTTDGLNHFLSKIDEGIAGGWLEGTTYSKLRSRYEVNQETNRILSII